MFKHQHCNPEKSLSISCLTPEGILFLSPTPRASWSAWQCPRQLQRLFGECLPGWLSLALVSLYCSWGALESLEMLSAAEGPGLASEHSKGTSLWSFTAVRYWSFLIQNREARCQLFVFIAEIQGLLFSFFSLVYLLNFSVVVPILSCCCCF